MKRISMTPGAQDPRTGAYGPGDGRRMRMEPQRLNFAASDAPVGPPLNVDGLTADAATASLTPQVGGPRAPAQPRSAVGSEYDHLYSLGVRALHTAAALDFDDIEGEFEEFGALSEQTYQRLESAGVPRRIVDNYIDGQMALGEKLTAEIHALVGGPERYAAMLEWARTALSREELVAFDDAVNSSAQAARLAVQGLYAEFVREVGEAPRFVTGAARPGRAGSSFASTQELVEAIRDPKYKKDPAYRAEVEQRLARSSIFGR